MTSGSSQTDLRACALAYAREGWPVFPLRSKEKIPLTKTGFKEAVYLHGETRAQAHDIVLAWWAAWPDANIGIATGVLFDVLDIDGAEGVQVLRHWIEEFNAEPPYHHTGPVSITGKGAHFLFATTGIGNKTKMLNAPIDFRGLGGYIVAPPSVHPLGHRYHWDEAHHRTWTTPLPPAPPWLTELLGPKPEPVSATVHGIRNSLGITPTKAGTMVMTRSDIHSVAIRVGLDPKPKGHYYLVACPFHDDSTPSMALYPRDNSFYCYGCQAHGDSHDLGQERDMDGKTFL